MGTIQRFPQTAIILSFFLIPGLFMCPLKAAAKTAGLSLGMFAIMPRYIPTDKYFGILVYFQSTGIWPHKHQCGALVKSSSSSTFSCFERLIPTSKRLFPLTIFFLWGGGTSHCPDPDHNFLHDHYYNFPPDPDPDPNPDLVSDIVWRFELNLDRDFDHYLYLFYLLCRFDLDLELDHYLF